ncbi:uncharacterized protein LOC128670896 [Plodia interpunctella]|uniref:uncharacterized protein LOC128670896 n=1 Tax=Plodia interpunctella TaxID=58824 RepID=UPI0023680D6D|nr:uncharacterized protein LOC128670896 [Plodia interpunctella]
MFTKITYLCALVAVSQAGLLAEPVHYSEAVSSQSIIRHDEPQQIATKYVSAPVAKLSVAPVSYQAPVYYQSNPVKYSVESSHVYQQPQITKLVAPVTKYVTAPVVQKVVSAPVYHSAPVSYSAPVQYSAPIAKVVAHEPEIVSNPKYEYSYSVADGHTGDNKSQQEVRDGDVVKGSYSFHEADGSIRTVEYSADDHSGFNAIVHNTAPTPAPVLVKAAPVLVKSEPVLQYYKIILLFCSVVVSQAVFIDPSQNFKEGHKNSKTWQYIKVYHPPSSKYMHTYDFYAYPKYEFEYAVSDKKTGDHKHHREHRDGDRVTGEYSLVEADGSLRKVQYDADDHHGFNAVVSKLYNKHGDNAFSVFDHTREFGRGVKINHYFPGKDYFYESKEIKEKQIIPVKESVQEPKKDTEETTKSEDGNNDESSKVIPNKVEQVAPTPIKVETVEVAPVKIIPNVVSMVMPNNAKLNSDMVMMPLVENASEKPETNETDKSNSEQTSTDSEGASSYYRQSRIYYVGF